MLEQLLLRVMVPVLSSVRRQSEAPRRAACRGSRARRPERRARSGTTYSEATCPRPGQFRPRQWRLVVHERKAHAVHDMLQCSLASNQGGTGAAPFIWQDALASRPTGWRPLPGFIEAVAPLE